MEFKKWSYQQLVVLVHNIHKLYSALKYYRPIRFAPQILLVDARVDVYWSPRTHFSFYLLSKGLCVETLLHLKKDDLADSSVSSLLFGSDKTVNKILLIWPWDDLLVCWQGSTLSDRFSRHRPFWKWRLVLFKFCCFLPYIYLSNTKVQGRI